MRPDEYPHARLLAQTVLASPACVLWCQGMDAPELAAAFGADLASATPMTYLEVEEEHYEYSVQTVLIGGLGDWTFAVEPNGGAAIDGDLAGRFAAAGTALAVFWNGPVQKELHYARDGRMLAAFHRAAREGIDDLAPEGLIDGLNFSHQPDDEFKISGLILGERISGHRLAPGWFDERHTRYVISTSI
ncbi:hypothetical protein J5X84_08890 [Streptosporangiaceae bacterium NEAU-GS5]|nr:hypothetical protein [Streptosporangiaceae bacterium NEAU-GS5]